VSARTRALGFGLVAASLCLLTSPSGASQPIEALLERAEKVRSSDPQAFRQLLDQLNAQAQQATLSQQEQLRYLNAYALAFSGQHEQAIQEARRLVASSEDVDLKYRAGALIVNSYASTRKFVEGLRQLEETLKLSGQVKDLRTRQYGLWSATVMYNQIGQYRQGLKYAEELLAESLPPRTRCFANQARLEALQNLNSLPASDAPIFVVIDDCMAQRELAAANFVRTTLARKWSSEGKRKQAIALLQNHLGEIRRTKFPRLIGEAESLLAELLLAEDESADAERHAQATIALAPSITNSLPLVVAYRTMYQITEQRRNPEASLNYYRSFAEADKNYLSDINARELAYQIVKQETQQKNQQIELLNRQNQVLQLKQRVSRQATQNTQLLAALLAILLATIGYWAYKIKRMQMSFRRLAETDTLTGISNRHHFTRQAEDALTYCARTGEDVGMIMFDLDHFKTINDRFGHEVGDFVLKRVAQQCKRRCRKNDRFGRLGGEEFAILLIGCDLETTTRMAQACCAHIAEIDTGETGHDFLVTASFGVTTASLSGYELTRMLSNADQMLYRSKHDGRNRVSVFALETQPGRVTGEQFA
jgi:diguanylate cyclase (GGDEF)-like protein